MFTFLYFLQILLLPGTRFVVLQQSLPLDDMAIVAVKEIAPSFLLKVGRDSSTTLTPSPSTSQQQQQLQELKQQQEQEQQKLEQLKQQQQAELLRLQELQLKEVQKVADEKTSQNAPSVSVVLDMCVSEPKRGRGAR